jgi:GNAT superfamily N-acetyltransferase
MKTLELHAADFADAAALANRVGWADTPADWHSLATCTRLLGLRDESGRLVATGGLCDFGRWVSVAKMLVHPDCRGRGYARRLLAETLALRREPDAVQSLIATPQGRPVYLRAGFVEVSPLRIFNGAGRGTGQAARLGDEYQEAAVALDAQAMGPGREAYLRTRWHLASLRVGHVEGGRLTGSGVLLAGSGGARVGPLYAADDAVAVGLLAALVEAASGPVRVDVAPGHPGVVAWLERAGFTEVEPRWEMILGGVPLPPRGTTRVCPVSLATG